MLMLQDLMDSKRLDTEEPDEVFEDNQDPLAEFGYEPI